MSEVSQKTRTWGPLRAFSRPIPVLYISRLFVLRGKTGLHEDWVSPYDMYFYGCVSNRWPVLPLLVFGKYFAQATSVGDRSKFYTGISQWRTAADVACSSSSQRETFKLTSLLEVSQNEEPASCPQLSWVYFECCCPGEITRSSWVSKTFEIQHAKQTVEGFTY